MACPSHSCVCTAHFMRLLVVPMQVDLIVALRSEALQLNETLRLAQLDKTEGEGQLQILKDKIAAKNLEGERSALIASPSRSPPVIVLGYIA